MRERHPRFFDALVWPMVVLGDAVMLLVFPTVSFLIVQNPGGQLHDLANLSPAEMARTSVANQALAGAAWSLVYTLSAIPAAWLGKKFGAQRIATLGVAFFVLVPFLMAQAHTVPMLMVTMGLLGIGCACLWPNVEAELSRGREGQLLRRRLSLFNIMWCVGTILGPFLGVWVYPSEAQAHSPAGAAAVRNVFYLCAGLGLLQLLLMTLWRVRLPSREEQQVPETLEAPHDPVLLRTFLLMTYVANCIAYIVLSVLRQLYENLAQFQWQGLAPAARHFWLLVAMAAAGTVMFVYLYYVHRWAYRLKRFIMWQVAMALAMTAVALSGNLLLVGAAFVLIGLATSFTYSGSLFYSLEGKDASKHMAGYHEALVGLGNLLGLLLAGFLPWLVRHLQMWLQGRTDESVAIRSSYIMVAVILALGLGVQLTIYFRATRRSTSSTPPRC